MPEIDPPAQKWRTVGNFFHPPATEPRNDIQLFGKVIRGSFSAGRRRLSSATLLQRSYSTADINLVISLPFPRSLLARVSSC